MATNVAGYPARYARYIGTDWSLKNEVAPGGQARYVPHGLRVIESLLLQRFSPEDIAVCYPDQMGLFIGEDTKVVGVHAHNPLGITFATEVYAYFYGRQAEPINAAEFRKLILHPAPRQHKPHLKLIVGGPGAWQIAPTVKEPNVIEELSEIAVGMSVNQHPASTDRERRYANLFVGLETGSTRLFSQHMKGKAYPYRAEQSPDVVLKGMEILNKHNWFPFCTFIIGLPGETREDTRQWTCCLP